MLFQRPSSNMGPIVALLVAAVLGVVAGHRGGRPGGKCFSNSTVTVDECCTIPQLADATVMENCKSQFPPNREQPKDGARRGHNGPPCITNCILTAMGGFKDDQIDTAGFKSAVRGVTESSPAFATLIEQTIDECGAFQSTDRTFLPPANNPDGGAPPCSVAPKIFLNCIYSKLFQNCPSTVWTDKPECSALKDKLKQGCPYFALRKHPKRDD